MPQPQSVTGLSNRTFLETYAAPGRIGLAGGADLISRLIGRAQRRLDDDHRPSLWSHAFIFQGPRLDRQHWVFESDLEVHKKNIRLGVQENRFEKYCCEDAYPTLAILDFGLADEHLSALFRESLDMVAGRIRYSLRELMGTLIGLHRPARRSRPNPLARQHSLFCSAFVTHVLRKAGLDPVPGLDVKHTAPEDLFRSEHARHIWHLQREPAPPPSLARRVATSCRARRSAKMALSRWSPGYSRACSSTTCCDKSTAARVRPSAANAELWTAMACTTPRDMPPSSKR
jgi:hypothetical protein